MILYIDEILYSIAERKIKQILMKKKDSKSLFKSLVMFHISVFIKMFCSGGNMHLKQVPDGRCCQQRMALRL